MHCCSSIGNSNSSSGLGLASWNGQERNKADDFPYSIHPAVTPLHPLPLLRKKGFLLELFLSITFSQFQNSGYPGINPGDTGVKKKKKEKTKDLSKIVAIFTVLQNFNSFSNPPIIIYFQTPKTVALYILSKVFSCNLWRDTVENQLKPEVYSLSHLSKLCSFHLFFFSLQFIY